MTTEKDGTQMPPKRQSNSADFKLQEVKHAAKNGNRAAERKFGVWSKKW